uniref:Uncharacterized protein n=1 Tax=Aegilops tauschii subsp. strangulata TaxID=200361 RepID=A0A453SL37_AEGTS
VIHTEASLSLFILAAISHPHPVSPISSSTVPPVDPSMGDPYTNFLRGYSLRYSNAA